MWAICSPGLVESQNNSGWKRPHEVSSPSASSKPCQLQVGEGCSRLCSAGPWKTPRKEAHNLLRPCPTAQMASWCPQKATRLPAPRVWWQIGATFTAGGGLPLRSSAASCWWCCPEQRFLPLVCYQGTEPTLQLQICRWRRCLLPVARSCKPSAFPILGVKTIGFLFLWLQCIFKEFLVFVKRTQLNNSAMNS